MYSRGENISLSIDTKDINSAIRHGSQVVELKGSLNENAIIKDVQWDAFGIDVLHLDLTRIDASESVDLTLPVELVGVAPGTRTGGMVKHLLHELQVSCPALAVPEKLELRINSLEMNGSMKASEVTLPEGANLLTGADEIVVQCVEAAAQEETADAAADGPAEPEVIGRKSQEDVEEGDN